MGFSNRHRAAAAAAAAWAAPALERPQMAERQVCGASESGCDVERALVQARVRVRE
jgi:hypothetical protein